MRTTTWGDKTDEHVKDTFTPIPAARIVEFIVFLRATLCPCVSVLKTPVSLLALRVGMEAVAF